MNEHKQQISAVGSFTQQRRLRMFPKLDSVFRFFVGRWLVHAPFCRPSLNRASGELAPNPKPAPQSTQARYERRIHNEATASAAARSSAARPKKSKHVQRPAPGDLEAGVFGRHRYGNRRTSGGCGRRCAGPEREGRPRQHNTGSVLHRLREAGEQAERQKDSSAGSDPGSELLCCNFVCIMFSVEVKFVGRKRRCTDFYTHESV